MVHKITVGVRDSRLGRGEQTIPLVGPGNPSVKMQKFLKRGTLGPTKIPRSVLNRAINNELKRRKQSRKK